MAYIECDLDHKVPSIYDTLDIESKNTLDMTYIKGYSFPVYTINVSMLSTADATLAWPLAHTWTLGRSKVASRTGQARY